VECPAAVEEKRTEKTVTRKEVMVKVKMEATGGATEEVKMVATETVRAEVMKKEGAAVNEENCDSTCKIAHAHQGSEWSKTSRGCHVH
jgi:hypothetical protein